MTSDELRAIRANLGAAYEATRRDGPDVPATPAFVGRVFAQVAVPTTTGVFFSVHPVAILGTEGESQPGAFSVDQSTTVLVYVVGSHVPVLGDYLICRFVDYRWVAERFGTKPSIPQPACRCALVPSSILFSGSYSHSPGIPGALSPTERGLPSTTTLTAQPTPSWYGIFVPSGTVWLSPSFTYSAFNSSTGTYQNHTAAILFACVFNTHELICGIVDTSTGQGLDCNLTAYPDSHSLSFACSPFFWQYSASCPNWFGTTTLAASR